MADTTIKFAETPKIPLNSLILVTGVNGLIDSHVANQLLAPNFESRHGAGRFELVEVADLTTPGVWEGPVRGVAGIASVAGVRRSSPFRRRRGGRGRPQSAFHPTGRGKSRTDRQVVYTHQLVLGGLEPGARCAHHRDGRLVEQKGRCNSRRCQHRPGEKGYSAVYGRKVKVEKACWAWVAREKPAFAFNTILPDMTIGPILDANNQTASTSGMVMWFYRGENLGILKGIPPQWYIDPRDTGCLFVAVLAMGVDGWRILGCAERFSWRRVLDILKRVYPGKKDFVDLPDNGEDQAEMQSDKPITLLRAVGQARWTSLEESVKVAAASDLSLPGLDVE